MFLCTNISRYTIERYFVHRKMCLWEIDIMCILYMYICIPSFTMASATAVSQSVSRVYFICNVNPVNKMAIIQKKKMKKIENISPCYEYYVLYLLQLLHNCCQHLSRLTSQEEPIDPFVFKEQQNRVSCMSLFYTITEITKKLPFYIYLKLYPLKIQSLY